MLKRNVFYEHSPRVLKNVLCFHASASCVVAYLLTRQQSQCAVSLYTCASSSTDFILYRVARYDSYVQRVLRAVQFVHHMFTIGSLRNKRAFRNQLNNLFFIYQRAQRYEEQMLIHPEQ